MFYRHSQSLSILIWDMRRCYNITHFSAEEVTTYQIPQLLHICHIRRAFIHANTFTLPMQVTVKLKTAGDRRAFISWCCWDDFMCTCVYTLCVHLDLFMSDSHCSQHASLSGLSCNRNSGYLLKSWTDIIFWSTNTRTIKMRFTQSDMWPWTTKPVLRVHFIKLRFMHHLKAE